MKHYKKYVSYCKDKNLFQTLVHPLTINVIFILVTLELSGIKGNGILDSNIYKVHYMHDLKTVKTYTETNKWYLRVVYSTPFTAAHVLLSSCYFVKGQLRVP